MSCCFQSQVAPKLSCTHKHAFEVLAVPVFFVSQYHSQPSNGIPHIHMNPHFNSSTSQFTNRWIISLKAWIDTLIATISKGQGTSQAESITAYCITTLVIIVCVAFMDLDSSTHKETWEEAIALGAVILQIDIMLFIQTRLTFGFRSNALYFFMSALRDIFPLHCLCFWAQL